MNSYVLRIYRVEQTVDGSWDVVGVIESAATGKHWGFNSLESLGSILAHEEPDRTAATRGGDE